MTYKSSEVCFQTVTVRVGDEYYPGHLILVVDD